MEEITDYERQRLERIQRNQAMLASLSIQSPIQAQEPVNRPVSPRKRKRFEFQQDSSDSEHEGRRRSKRLQAAEKAKSMQGSGDNTSQLESVTDDTTPDKIPDKSHWSNKTLYLSDTYPVAITTSAELGEESSQTLEGTEALEGCDRFLASLLALEVDKSRTSIIMKTLPNSEKGGEEHNEKPLSGTIFDNIKSWKLQTTKVTPDRAYSTAFYPSSEKLVITVGDLNGRIGFWDLKESKVIVCQPHTKTVSDQVFAPSSGVGGRAKLFSCSHDGHLRCMDLIHSPPTSTETSSSYKSDVVFESIFSTKSMLSCLDITKSGQVCWVGDNRGYLTRIDIRTKSPTGEFSAHEKRVNSVHIHPHCEYLLVSSARDGNVEVFDTRMLKPDSEEDIVPINSFRHVDGATSAYFSPITGNSVLTTGLDDVIAVWSDFNTSSAQSSSSDDGDTHVQYYRTQPKRVMRIAKDNQTGKWIAGFKAQWDPYGETHFVVGSKNLNVQIFNASNGTCEHILDADMRVIPSLTIFHPEIHAIGAANGSGCCYVWAESL